jgi:hypothetical protein
MQAISHGIVDFRLLIVDFDHVPVVLIKPSSVAMGMLGHTFILISGLRRNQGRG